MIYRALCLIVLAASVAVCSAAGAAPRPHGATANDLAAQRRTRITVYPRTQVLGPNSVRQCRAWLTQEFRPSGTVIVPRQQCWWE